MIVSVGFRREQIGHPMDGFGFVVPQVENRRILSGSFSSVKYAERAPDDCELIRVFVGGASNNELTQLSDDELGSLVCEELGQLLQIRGVPILQHIRRWPTVMPQYHVGHVDLINQIEQRAAALPGLALAGNAYHGLGIPHCIHSGQRAAECVFSEVCSLGTASGRLSEMRH